jgi:hypothetical protein
MSPEAHMDEEAFNILHEFVEQHELDVTKKEVSSEAIERFVRGELD